MNLDIKKYHHFVLETAKESRKAIEAAQAEYNDSLRYHETLFRENKITKAGYDESMAFAAQRRDEKIEAAAQEIRKVQRDFDVMLDDLGKIDGGMIDDATMKILNSGMELTSREWQDLADKHRDNATMTRILKEHYGRIPFKKNMPDGFLSTNQKESEPEVVFGQLPEIRKATFDSLCNVLYYSAKSGTVLPQYDSQTSYWNSLARHSLSQMKPLGEETFEQSQIESEFPVTECTPKQNIF